LIEFTVDSECLDEPCNSEGLDNTVLGWTTDFFIAGSMILFGLHLLISQHAVYFSTIIALLCMGVAYVLGGLGHSIWTNSGFDDNVAQQEFFITWAISFTFMTVSVHQTYRFVNQILNQYPQMEIKNERRLMRFLNMSLFLVIASWAVTLVGYIWCATESDLHVDGAIDEVPELENDSDTDTCYVIAAWGEGSWYVTFSLFWVPVGTILRRVILANANVAQEQVYGLSNSLAALFTTIIPWTFGIMIIVYSAIVAIILDKDGVDIYVDIYGAVIYHFGMLVQYFLLHNLAFSLPPPFDTEKPEADFSASAPNQEDSETSQAEGGGYAYAY